MPHNHSCSKVKVAFLYNRCRDDQFRSGSCDWMSLTPSTAYSMYSIHQEQHTPSTAYTKYSIHQVQHTPRTAYTKCSIHCVQHIPSAAYTQYRIHQVKHSANTASTQDWLSSLHCHDSRFTHDCSLNVQWAFPHDWLLSAISPLKLTGEVTLWHSHTWELTNWRTAFQHLVRGLWTTSKYSSNVALSRPPRVLPATLDHGIAVNVRTHSITASKCIARVPRLPPACSYDQDIPVQ